MLDILEAEKEYHSGFVHIRAQNSLILPSSPHPRDLAGLCMHTQQDLARTPKCSSSLRELGLTWGLLGLHLLPALLQHRLALGGGKHPCGRYSPSFPLPCLLCPYSAHLKQETIKARRLSICLLHNLQLLTSALNSGMFLSSASSSCSLYTAKFYKFSNASSDARAPLKPL